MMISKSYSEYLQKWLLYNSHEFLTEFSTPPSLTIACSHAQKNRGGKFKFKALLISVYARGKFKLKGLLNICLCARFTYHQDSIRVRTGLLLKWFSHMKCSALINGEALWKWRELKMDPTQLFHTLQNGLAFPEQPI